MSGVPPKADQASRLPATSFTLQGTGLVFRIDVPHSAFLIQFPQFLTPDTRHLTPESK
jgi:hypothetical protein